MPFSHIRPQSHLINPYTDNRCSYVRMVQVMWSNNFERRAFGRRAHLKVGKIIHDNQSVSVLVVNMSKSGAQIRTSSPLTTGERLVLEIDEDDFVAQCRVQWINRLTIGLEFIKSPMRLSWRRVRRTNAKSGAVSATETRDLCESNAP